MANYYVYEHWRLDRDECFYVGRGHGRRAYDMGKSQGRNRHHLAIQAKVAREGFAIEVRIVASGLTNDEANALEVERIAFWRSCGIDLANLTNGGEGAVGFRPSEATKAKQRAAALLRQPPSAETRQKMAAWIRSPETRQKISTAQSGKIRGPHSEETKAKISAVHKGRKASEETLVKLRAAQQARYRRNAELGIREVRAPHSEQTKRKMSEARVGRKFGPHSEAHRAKISKALMGHPGSMAMLGRKHTDETRAKLRDKAATLDARVKWAESAKAGPKALSRSVVCMDDGLVYESASAAAQHYKVAKSALIEMCLGRKYRKSVGGLHFQYLLEEA
jgi:hypothetical protein